MHGAIAGMERSIDVLQGDLYQGDVSVCIWQEDTQNPSRNGPDPSALVLGIAPELPEA